MIEITTSTAAVALGNEGLTAAIRQEHQTVSTAARSALWHALEAGRLLAEAKAEQALRLAGILVPSQGASA